ncbi:tetratricopeptide repeat protein 1 isoform X4 [Ixodes scapularis]
MGMTDKLIVSGSLMDSSTRDNDRSDDRTTAPASDDKASGTRRKPDCPSAESERHNDATIPEAGYEAEVDSDAEDLYAVDEEKLVELEKDMTEEEKASRRERAQQLKATGNGSFKEGLYMEALEAYTEALRICPLDSTQERSVLFSNRAATWTRLEKNKFAVKDCTRAIELNPTYLKPVLKRAQLHKELDNLDDSLKDYQRVLELDPSVGEARHACMTLPDQIKERNEKLQAEMIGKLKELGNLCLKPFGMSTDNFKLVKDDDSGGYKIHFQK